jgi:ABC-type multidrug transport system fused ATPase/permease subunit
LAARITAFFLHARLEEGGLVAHAPSVPVRELLRRFWPYLRAHRRKLWASLALVCLVPLLEAATIWMYKVAVDEVVVPHDLHAFVWVAAVVAGLTLLQAITSFGDDYLSAWIGERFLFDLRTALFGWLHNLSLDFFERRRLGDLIARLTGDVAAIETLVLSGVADALAYIVRIVLFAAALIVLRWDLALAAFAVAPLFWLTTRHFSREIKRASREKRRRSGSLTAVAEESLGNVALVQAYGRERSEVERFAREGSGVRDAELEATRLRAVFSPLTDVFEMFGMLSVVGLGTWELTQGRLSLGGLVAFLTYLSQLYSPVRRLSRLINTVHAASASAERILELLDQRPTVRTLPSARRLRSVAGFVAFERVSFRYPGTSRDALDDVSFGVAPGETLALVGPSGAGKSTVAKLLLRFYDADAGRVCMDGEPVDELRLPDLREHMALLLQETLIFDGTVRENIAFGRAGVTTRQIEEAAEAADAARFIGSLPEGYDTTVGQRGRRLSGGQRQRIAIARAMVRDAPVLILDEPTTGLDATSARRTLSPLRRLMQGRTTLVISHNLLTTRYADRILVLDRGRVAERGTHEDLITRGGLYAELWHAHREPAATPPHRNGRPARTARAGRPRQREAGLSP